MWRARLRMCPTVSSAAEMMFEVGAFTTMTPAVVAALMSTLSSPTPARAMTLSSRRGGDRLGVDLRRGTHEDRVRIGERREERRRGRCRRRCGSRSRARGRRRWRARVLRRSARPALTRTIPSGAKRAHGALMCDGMRHTPWGRYPATLLEGVCGIRSVTTRSVTRRWHVRRSRCRRARRTPRGRG